MNKYSNCSLARDKQINCMLRAKQKITSDVASNMGYLRSGHSAGASNAYQNFKKPYNEWEMKNFHSNLWRMLREDGSFDEDEIRELDYRLSDYGKFYLRKRLLKSAHEKHHVGDHFELVAFYEIDKTKLIDFAREELATKRRYIPKRN